MQIQYTFYSNSMSLKITSFDADKRVRLPMDIEGKMIEGTETNI